jgi:uncharacterized protein
MSPRSLTVSELQRLASAQRVLTHAVRVADTPEAIDAAMAAGYPELDLAPDDARVFAETDRRRIHVYGKLVRSTLKDVVQLEIPRAVARMGSVAYSQTMADFFHEELPRSRVLRDVAYEVVAWAAPRWAASDQLPAYVNDLARFELFEFEVYTAERTPDDEPVTTSDELAADQTLAFNGTARIAKFDFAVHKLADDVDDRTEPEAGSFGVLAYRDGDGKYRQMDLTPLATSIFGAMWREGLSLAEAVQRACATHGRQLGQDVIDGTSTVIEDLSSRGVVLGGMSVTTKRVAPSPWAHRLFSAEALVHP